MSSTHTPSAPTSPDLSAAEASPADKLQHFRQLMAAQGLDAFIIPREDEYQNEYPPRWAERLAWLTGFTGSAGFAVVMADKAVVMSDGRYTIQLRQQCDAALYDVADSTKTTAADWLLANTNAPVVVGYDPKLLTPRQLDRLRDKLSPAGHKLVALADNLVDLCWTNHRPALPADPVSVFPINLAGVDSAEKRAQIAAQLQKAKADCALITAQDSIAWLLNIRGNDVPHTPLALSHVLLHADGQAEWFIAPDKITDAVRAHLGNGVAVQPPAALQDALGSLSGKAVQFDASRGSVWLRDLLDKAEAKIIDGKDPCILPKACKNAAEVGAMRAAHIRDGAAMVTFLHWLEAALPAGDQTEITLGDKLRATRALAAEFRDTSFDSIVGFNAHGAIIHYRAENDPANAATVKGDGLLLLDSGAQYCDGTTDITRTLPVGTPTPDMRRAFTAVLKGHIALAQARFPQGTTGAQLDAMVRAPLWGLGLDFAHGTGHGVGCYLSVHEEAASISPRGTEPPMPGMVISNEPGYYREGAFGIRIENLVLCTDTGQTYDDGRKMLAFDTLTLCPIDTRLVETSMLTQSECDWLNAYHVRVRDTLTPLVSNDAAQWLAARTGALTL